MFQFLASWTFERCSASVDLEGVPKKDDKAGGKQISPGENDIIRAIENKRANSRSSAQCAHIYLDHRSAFVKGNMSAVVGALRQFGSPQLNSFKLDEVKDDFHREEFRKEEKNRRLRKNCSKNYCKRGLSRKPL